MTADINPGAGTALNLRQVRHSPELVRRFGFLTAVILVGLSVAYAIPLTIGLITLPSADQPIGDPWFPMMEWLILLSAPLMVALSVCIHVAAPPSRRPFSLASLVFMGLAVGVTCSVHFTVFTLTHQPEIASLPWAPSLLSFTWPSVPYALDIVAWDFFFPLSVFLAAPVFGGSRLANAIRGLLLGSGLLSLVGLFGPAVNNMEVRSIGIIGYAVVYPIAVVLIARMFGRPIETSVQDVIDLPATRAR